MFSFDEVDPRHCTNTGDLCSADVCTSVLAPCRVAERLSAVARAAEISRAVARRYLLTLEQLGYVRSEGHDFELTARVLELGFSYLSSLSLPELLQPHLEALSHTLDESTSASVLDGDDIVYITRVPTRRIMNVGITIGTRFPAHVTSMGRVLLAALPDDQLDARLGRLRPVSFTDATVTDVEELRAIILRVRKRGFALVDQELERGLRSIAAPVQDRDGSARVAINVSSAASSSTLETVRDVHRPALLATARAIEASIQLAGAAAAGSSTNIEA